MKTIKYLLLALAALSLTGLVGCGDDETTKDEAEPGQVWWFSGRVYDGATGQRLTGYSISLQYMNTTVRGKVDGEGRYVVGPLMPFYDYTVRIDAEGYRSFFSHNEMVEPAREWDPYAREWVYLAPELGFYFDAYLFPTSVESPAVHFDVSLEGSAAQAAGTVRLTPVASSWLGDWDGGPAVLAAPGPEVPAGVGDQVWGNDDDLQFRAVTKAFTDGAVDFEQGELVYGVTYQVTIFGVEGYQGGVMGWFTAGWDTHEAFVLERQARDGLELVYVSSDEGRPTGSAEVVFVFNQAVEWDPRFEEALYHEAIDDAIVIQSPDWDDDGVTNTLNADDSEFEQERGTSVTLEGNVLTLTWDEDGLDSQDGDDPVFAVTYGNLTDLLVRPVGGTASDATSVGNLLGSDATTVVMTAVPPR